jgi:hypothetical protein
VQVIDTGRRFISESHEHVVLLNTRLIRWAALLNGHYLNPCLLLEVETASQSRRYRHDPAVQTQVTARYPAMLHELRQDRLGHVDRNGKANALRRLNHRRVDADDMAVAIRQGATGIARIQSCVCLDDVIDQVAGNTAQRSA